MCSTDQNGQNGLHYSRFRIGRKYKRTQTRPKFPCVCAVVAAVRMMSGGSCKSIFVKSSFVRCVCVGFWFGLFIVHLRYIALSLFGSVFTSHKLKFYNNEQPRDNKLFALCSSRCLCLSWLPQRTSACGVCAMLLINSSASRENLRWAWACDKKELFSRFITKRNMQSTQHICIQFVK